MSWGIRAVIVCETSFLHASHSSPPAHCSVHDPVLHVYEHLEFECDELSQKFPKMESSADPMPTATTGFRAMGYV